VFRYLALLTALDGKSIILSVALEWGDFAMKIAKIVGAACALFFLAAPAYSDTLTVDITGTGSGSLDGTAFSSQLFDLHLAGPQTGGSLISLTTANITIGAGPAVDFTSAMQIGLHFSPDYAFFGYQGGSDIIHLLFTPSDFAALQNSPFNVPATVDANAFTNVSTSGGLLSFDSFSGVNLQGVSTRNAAPGCIANVRQWPWRIGSARLA
jgi:hypothetical protein